MDNLVIRHKYSKWKTQLENFSFEGMFLAKIIRFG